MRLDRRAPRRHYLWLLYHLALLALWCGLVLPALLEAANHDWGDDLIEPIPAHAEAHLTHIADHLNGPFHGYARAQVLDDNFDVIALSHMASGLMNVYTSDESRRDELAPLAREVVARALDPRVSPYKKHPDEVDEFGDHNLYLSHLNLILGVHRHITGDEEFDALHTRVAKHLRAASLADGDWHARSYPVPSHLEEREGAYKWPADQAALLASLFVYDMTRGAKLSARPIRGWLRHMSSDEMRSEDGELPRSALDRKVAYARFPRGCALSWTVFYMTQFAPDRAAELYDVYRHRHAASVLGWGGFREWPHGVDRGVDTDSGPVILGVGTAASGLGLGPARMMRDVRQYALIMRAASTFGLPTRLLPARRYLTSPLLGEAILFSGATARVWFGDPPKIEPYPESAPWPSGVSILIFVLSAFIFYSLSSIREQIQAIRSWR